MIYSKLKKLGVLGMNDRIINYMSPLNSRQFYPLVDDKILTATLAQKESIPMPDNYRIFESYGDTKNLEQILSEYDSFVIKPARGAMGNGIIVIGKSENGLYYKTSGKSLDIQTIRYHILQIIGGLYSLGSFNDRAILQYKVSILPEFESYAVNGTPDIRVIVYKGYPVLSMTRLPTIESDGRANLHQGAVGAGIDICSGCVIHAEHNNTYIEKHPDTQTHLIGLRIPYWQQILEISAKCYDITHLGYLGVDIVLDKDRGPLILEMNARPGLAIQLANNRGLKKILKAYESKIGSAKQQPKERVQKAIEIQKELFGDSQTPQSLCVNS